MTRERGFFSQLSLAHRFFKIKNKNKKTGKTLVCFKHFATSTSPKSEIKSDTNHPFTKLSAEKSGYYLKIKLSCYFLGTNQLELLEVLDLVSYPSAVNFEHVDFERKNEPRQDGFVPRVNIG